ncbi:glutathione S-transferase family protein [Psychromonas sp. RZ22]|uniref:glutathione S-transferase family protein n=1 Tax=Psychromonas algarum TaxID=2555643 RepID=UPI0010688B4C|nr:glutathione S-transferase family protein [Psychromonas sp. RZ22]TEW55391.1 glutathione S-transferase family protein [Psychromonas sp. RZ22]
MTIYGDSLSGNCYKVKLLCSLLQIDYEWIDIDILAGETQTSEFLALNPNAKIPVLVTEDQQVVSESNAILFYLSQQSAFFPAQVYQQTLCLQWMFFEQYSHEPYIAVARFINKYLGKPESRLAEFNAKQEGGNKALSIIETQLQKTNYLLGDSISIADICLFAYTHVADEGGFNLNEYPYILNWIANIKSQKNFVPMTLSM